MARVAPAEPAGRKDVHAQHPEARLAGSESPEEFAGVIARPVVYHDDLDLDALLREQTDDRTVETWALIASRDDDGATRYSASESVLGGGTEGRQPACPAQLTQSS